MYDQNNPIHFTAAGVKLLLKGCGSPTYPLAKMHESIASPWRGNGFVIVIVHGKWYSILVIYYCLLATVSSLKCFTVALFKFLKSLLLVLHLDSEQNVTAVQQQCCSDHDVDLDKASVSCSWACVSLHVGCVRAQATVWDLSFHWI